jgi:hypothetical protein
MADLNTGIPLRFTNGGLFQIKNGSSWDTVKNISAGTLNLTIPGLDSYTHMDQGTIITQITGDERPATASLRCKIGSGTGVSGELPDAMFPADSGGEKGTFDCRFVFFTFRGATGANAAKVVTLEKCFLPDGLNTQPGSGQEGDEFVLNITSNKPPLPAAAVTSITWPVT